MNLRSVGTMVGVAVLALTAAACGASGSADDTISEQGGDAVNDAGASRVATAPGAESGPLATDGSAPALATSPKVIFSSELTLEASDVTARFL